MHAKFKLWSETLYITVNIIDRYLSAVRLPGDKLQLLGTAAMLISTKYEEIYPPTVRDFLYISDKQFTREELLKMEESILFQLQFNM